MAVSSRIQKVWPAAAAHRMPGRRAAALACAMASSSCHSCGSPPSRRELRGRADGLVRRFCTSARTGLSGGCRRAWRRGVGAVGVSDSLTRV
jgi:hypothetical protein